MFQHIYVYQIIVKISDSYPYVLFITSVIKGQHSGIDHI
jgi:hypothetical protein